MFFCKLILNVLKINAIDLKMAIMIFFSNKIENFISIITDFIL